MPRERLAVVDGDVYATSSAYSADEAKWEQPGIINPSTTTLARRRVLISDANNNKTTEDETAPRIVLWWAKCIQAHACKVIFLFLAGALASVPFMHLLLDRTASDFGLKHGSPSKTATAKLDRHFPGRADAGTVVVLVQGGSPGFNLLADDDDDNTAGSSSDLNAFCAWEADIKGRFLSKFSSGSTSQEQQTCDSCFARSFTSACELYALNATQLAVEQLTERAATIEIAYATSSTKTKIHRMIRWLARRAREANENERYSFAGVTGLDVFSMASAEGVSDDLRALDTVSAPIALAVLGLTVGYLPLLIVPLLTMLCALPAAFVLTGLLADRMHVASFAPSVMSTMTLALCFDYSLFCCSRFVEARRKLTKVTATRTPTVDMINGAAVAAGSCSASVMTRARLTDVFRGAGHAMLVSGVTLLCCFVGLLLFPADAIASVGAALAIGLGSALTVNLTLGPAVLAALGEPLCAAQDRLFRWCCCCASPDATADDDDDNAARRRRRRRRRRGSRNRSTNSNNEIEMWGPTLGERLVPGDGPTTTSHNGAVDDDDDDTVPAGGRAGGHFINDGSHSTRRRGGKLKPKSIWSKVGAALWDDKRVALVACLVVTSLAAPLAWRASKLSTLLDPAAVAPSPSPPQRALKKLGEAFGAGTVAPLTLVFERKAGATLDDALLDAYDDVLVSVCGDDIDAECGRVDGLSRFPGGEKNNRVTAEDYAKCGVAPDGTVLRTPTTSTCASLGVAASSLFSSQAVLAVVSLGDDPYSRKGIRWIRKARKRVKKNTDAYFDGVYVEGSPASLVDTVAALYDAYPKVVGATMLAVFSVLGLAFRSIVVALRSVVALGLTLAVSFGTTVLAYQDLDRGDDRSHSTPVFLTTRGSDPGVSWVAPLLCFSVIVGLAVDYDAFLLCGLYEYRVTKRRDDRTALLLALDRTGLVVSSAGAIMVVSFSGLFASSTCILNQVAALLVVAVAFDTLVVRCLFMPAFISLLGSRAWWPAPLPTPFMTKLGGGAGGDDDDDQTGDDDDAGGSSLRDALTGTQRNPLYPSSSSEGDDAFEEEEDDDDDDDDAGPAARLTPSSRDAASTTMASAASTATPPQTDRRRWPSLFSSSSRGGRTGRPRGDDDDDGEEDDETGALRVSSI